MKLLVISDSHNNLANLKHVLGFAQNIKAGAVIHCGDWNTLESVETVLSFGIPLYAVVGNADIADNIKNKFKESLEFELDNKKIGVCHSIVNCLPAQTGKLKIENLDIVFCGHTHKQGITKNITTVNKIVRLVNPGALENDINFAVYDTVTGKVVFIHE